MTLPRAMKSLNSFQTAMGNYGVFTPADPNGSAYG
jgi:hypothetical protein